MRPWCLAHQRRENEGIPVKSGDTRLREECRGCPGTGEPQAEVFRRVDGRGLKNA